MCRNLQTQVESYKLCLYGGSNECYPQSDRNSKLKMSMQTTPPTYFKSRNPFIKFLGCLIRTSKPQTGLRLIRLVSRLLPNTLTESKTRRLCPAQATSDVLIIKRVAWNTWSGIPFRNSNGCLGSVHTLYAREYIIY